jgi:AcrR family transcriptional regulator
MAGQQRWLDAGLEALAEEGAAGLKIDRLTRRLGVTKGSFFHHFASAAAYQTALLAHIEATGVAQVEAREGELQTASPRQVLSRMTAAVGDSTYGLWRADLEVALRAWSFTDPEVRATQDRIDQRRLAMLEAIWRQLEPDPERARVSARLPYLILVGASMSAIDPDELQRVYELILPLVPAAAPSPRLPSPDGKRGSEPLA